MKEDEFLKPAFKPQRSLGQNFLLSPLHLTKLASAAQLDNNTDVIEIGAGYGSLTRYLLQVNPRRVISIEKDPRLFSWLNSDWSFHPRQERLSFLLADALEVEWEKLVEASHNFQQRSIVIGNLPYKIANQLVSKLVRKQQLFRRLVFLVQKEVAQRWVANNTFYKNKYSSLSVTLNYFCKTELVFEVPKCFFKPQPPVDGAVVILEFREDLPVDFPTESFFTFTKNCFRFRRKTLLNNLRGFRGRESLMRRALTAVNLPEKVRPQDLSLKEYLQLFKAA